MPPVPPLNLNAYNSSTSWLHEAYVVYDGAEPKMRETIEKITEGLVDKVHVCARVCAPNPTPLAWDLAA